MDLLLEGISWLGIILPVVLIFFEKNDKKFFRIVSGYFLLLAIVISLKFFFGPSRNYIDPFEFPSLHMAFVSLFMFFYPNLFTLLFSILIGEARILLGLHNGIAIVAGFVCSAFSYLIVKLIENRRIRRQFVHIGLSLSFALILYINRIFGIASLIFLTIGYFLTYGKSIVKKLTSYFGKEKFDFGTINLMIGILLVSIFWKGAWIAAIFLGFVDGLATIFGYRKEKKSLIGFIGGLTGGFIASIVSHTSLILAPIVALVELLSPTDDNLTIPISVWVILEILLKV